MPALSENRHISGRVMLQSGALQCVNGSQLAGMAFYSLQPFAMNGAYNFQEFRPK
jgi:hypothetical protein